MQLNFCIREAKCNSLTLHNVDRKGILHTAVLDRYGKMKAWGIVKLDGNKWLWIHKDFLLT
jgi:hypothetical protein